jgi:hypothetical protein
MHYASTFNYNLYIDAVYVENYRIALCQLRLSSHRCYSETNRWNKPLIIIHILMQYMWRNTEYRYVNRACRLIGFIVKLIGGINN